MQSVAIRGHPLRSDALSRPQRRSEGFVMSVLVIIGHQRSSEVIRGPSEVIRGNERAIRGHQRSSVAISRSPANLPLLSFRSRPPDGATQMTLPPSLKSFCI